MIHTIIYDTDEISVIALYDRLWTEFVLESSRFRDVWDVAWGNKLFQ